MKENVMIFKSKTSVSLSGIHSSIIAFCENDTCNADQIVWVSEHFEKPMYEQAVRQLYEIGWDFVDVDDVTHVLCCSCVKLFISEKDTMKLETGEIKAVGRVNVSEDEKY